MPKKVAIGAKPAARQNITADEWVDGAASSGHAAPEKVKRGELTRYTIDIPVELHAKIKSYCALKHVKMRDEIITMLEKHFG
jgi:hypothetical protein